MKKIRSVIRDILPYKLVAERKRNKFWDNAASMEESFMDIVNYMDKHYRTQKTRAGRAVCGLSMGGAAVLMTSGENLPVNLKCIISDCAYTSVKDELFYHYKKIL